MPSIYTLTINKDEFLGEEMTSLYWTDKKINITATKKLCKGDILLIISLKNQGGMLLGVTKVNAVRKYDNTITEPLIIIDTMIDVRGMNITGLVSKKRNHDIVNVYQMNYMRYPDNFHNMLSSILKLILLDKEYVLTINSLDHMEWYKELNHKLCNKLSRKLSIV